MSVTKRIVLSVYLAVVILLCLVLLFSIFGVIGQDYVTHAVATMMNGSTGYQVLYAAIAIALVVVGVCLIFLDFRPRSPKSVKIAAVENGSIMITVRAIEELVGRYLKQQENIKELHAKVQSFEEYVEIQVDISIFPGVNIPEVTRGIHEGLKQSVESQTGIEVRDVKILVQNIVSEAVAEKLNGAVVK